jgi:hypothetical protein
MVFPAHHPATKLITALPPGTDEMSKHSAPGGDGAVLTGPPCETYKEWEMIDGPH